MSRETFLRDHGLPENFIERNNTLNEELVTVRNFKANTIIVKEGELGDSMFIILRGQVSVKSCGYHHVIRDKGSLIGEQAFLEKNQKRTATIETIGSGELLEITYKQIKYKLSINEQLTFYQKLSKTLSNKLAEATGGRADLEDRIQTGDELLNKFVPQTGIGFARAVVLGENNPSTFGYESKAIIWFSDIAGFSQLSNGKSPKEVAELISQLLGSQTDIIYKFGGEIDKYIGDGLMAFWLLKDQDDIPKKVEQAIKASLEARSSIIKLAEDLKLAIGIRIGLHIGDVMVGSFGTADRFSYTLLGEAVNDASRYEQCKDKELTDVRLSDKLYEELNNHCLKSKFNPISRSFTMKEQTFNAHTLKE